MTRFYCFTRALAASFDGEKLGYWLFVTDIEAHKRDHCADEVLLGRAYIPW